MISINPGLGASKPCTQLSAFISLKLAFKLTMNSVQYCQYALGYCHPIVLIKG